MDDEANPYRRDPGQGAGEDAGDGGPPRDRPVGGGRTLAEPPADSRPDSRPEGPSDPPSDGPPGRGEPGA
ncbi:hypothetical protein NKH77_12805 [Streptomyces sp. M19]